LARGVESSTPGHCLSSDVDDVSTSHLTIEAFSFNSSLRLVLYAGSHKRSGHSLSVVFKATEQARAGQHVHASRGLAYQVDIKCIAMTLEVEVTMQQGY
jgi:hypothetical protein